MSSTPDPQTKRIEDTRSFVRRILTGELTPDTHPWTFEEDAVIHALLFLLQQDRPWLDAQLVDESYARAARDLVRRNMPQERLPEPDEPAG